MAWGGMVLLMGMASMGCAPSEQEAPREEEMEVLDVLHDFFQALEAREQFRMSTLLHPQATITRVKLEGDALEIGAAPKEEWLQGVSPEGPPLIEQLHDPVVQCSGRFADVWAAYDFRIGEELSHCGYDAFQLVKEADGWRILGITYTIESCD